MKSESRGETPPAATPAQLTKQTYEADNFGNFDYYEVEAVDALLVSLAALEQRIRSIAEAQWSADPLAGLPVSYFIDFADDLAKLLAAQTEGTKP